jgi:hypothetical protein
VLVARRRSQSFRLLALALLLQLENLLFLLCELLRSRA